MVEDKEAAVEAEGVRAVARVRPQFRDTAGEAHKAACREVYSLQEDNTPSSVVHEGNL